VRNRGNVKAETGDLAGAIADFDLAIGRMKAIAGAMAKSWPIPFQYDLAITLYNRALARRLINDSVGARPDVAEAKGILERLVATLGASCPAIYRQLLAATTRLHRELP